MTHNTRRGALAALVLAATTALTGCGALSEPPTGPTPVENPVFEPGTTMDRLAKAGRITVGTKFDQPLFGQMGPEGYPVGFDVEIAKIIAAQLGIPADKIEWKEAVSANREPFIESGQVDMIVATYTISDSRKKVISFAGPYYTAGQGLLVAANDDTVQTEADVVDKPVCSVTGSTPAEKIKELGARTLLTDSYSKCLDPIRNGQAIAMTTDNVILAGLVAQNEGEFKVAGDGHTFTEEPYGVGIKHEDAAFRAFINDALEASYGDGTHEKAWDSTVGAVLPYVAPPALERY